MEDESNLTNQSKTMSSQAYSGQFIVAPKRFTASLAKFLLAAILGLLWTGLVAEYAKKYGRMQEVLRPILDDKYQEGYWDGFAEGYERGFSKDVKRRFG